MLPQSQHQQLPAATPVLSVSTQARPPMRLLQPYTHVKSCTGNNFRFMYLPKRISKAFLPNIFYLVPKWNFELLLRIIKVENLPDSQYKKYSKDFIVNVVFFTSFNRSFIFSSILECEHILCWRCTAAAPGSAEGPKTGTGTTPLRAVCILVKIFTLVSLSVIFNGPVLHLKLMALMWE